MQFSSHGLMTFLHEWQDNGLVDHYAYWRLQTCITKSDKLDTVRLSTAWAAVQ